MKTAVFLPDEHLKTTPAPHTKKGWKPVISNSLVACMKFCHDFKPDVTILGGDVVDLSEISRFNERKKLTVEGLRLEHTFEIANEFLDEVDEFSKGDKVYLMGNHEAWLPLYIEQHPVLHGAFSIEKNLRLKERGYEIIPENKCYKLGHARFIHGWYWTKYHSAKTVSEMGDNVFYGHTHDLQSYTKTNYESKPIIGHSCGCLCELDPDWRRGRPNRWVNGFGVFYFLPNGNFTFYNPIIIDGKFIWNGKLYDGGK